MSSSPITNFNNILAGQMVSQILSTVQPNIQACETITATTTGGTYTLNPTCLQALSSTIQNTINQSAQENLLGITQVYNIPAGSASYTAISNSLNALTQAVNTATQTCLQPYLQQTSSSQELFTAIQNCVTGSPNVTSAVTNFQNALNQATSCATCPTCASPSPPTKCSYTLWIILVSVLGFLVLALGIGLVTSFATR